MSQASMVKSGSPGQCTCNKCDKVPKHAQSLQQICHLCTSACLSSPLPPPLCDLQLQVVLAGRREAICELSALLPTSLYVNVLQLDAAAVPFRASALCRLCSSAIEWK
jgi:hypothetical protein